MYFRHSAEKPPAPFSCSGRRPSRDAARGVGRGELLLPTTPVVVRERGRGRAGICCSNGVVGVALDGDGTLGVAGGEGLRDGFGDGSAEVATA
jgi:hypothetical protein